MKSKQYRNRVSRKPALSTISVGVMAALIAGSAGATGAGGEADYSDNSTAAQVIGATSSYSNPYNVSNINAAVIGTQGGNNTTNSGTASQGSTSVTDNAIAAKAIANTITNTLSLSDIDSPSPANSGNKGLVFLGNAINNGDAGGPGTAVISSLVDSTRLDNSTSGSAPGSTSINNNTISATTLVNTTASTINGQVPVGYTSATPGEFKLGTDGSRSFTSTATIVSASAQKTTEAGSSATVTSNAVTLNITPPSGSTITADASLTGNSVSANVKANSAASSIGLQAASSTFTGSAVLSNTQVSEDARPNALNDASTIAAVISQNPSQTSLGNSVLGGKLAVTGNTISSSAIVNESLGNSISLGSLAFTGGGTAMPGVKLNGYGNINDSASLGMDVKADLVMVNAQSNQTDFDEPKAIVSAKTSNGRVTAVSDALTNGTINVSANTIQSIAKGNAASSTLASTATPASFSGSAALASQQENVYSGVTATTSTATISSNVLAVTGGNNSVTSNTQSAEARGNVVDQSLTLAATTLNQSAAPTTTTALTSGVSIIGPVTVGSLQTNSNAIVSATNSSSSATLTTNAVSASTLSLSQNTQSALALANIAGNTLSLSGTSVGAGAGIANVQQLSNTSPVAANLISANISASTSATSSDITNSTNSVASNIQSADARGNASNQLLTLTTTTLNTGNSSGMTTLGDGVGIVNATGPVTVSNLQVNTSSSLSAVNSNSAADLIVQGTSKVTGSTLSVFNNTQSALALANNAANTLSLSGTSVTGSAGIANVQQLSNASTVTASLTDAASYLSTLAVDSSAVSVKNNTAKASAFGNVSANALGVVATTVTGIAAGTPASSTVTYDSAITPSNKVLTSSVNSGYGLRNDQSVLSDISATANNSLSGSSAFRVKTSDVTNSQILNTGNAFSAVAEGNTATSGITLNANSITSPSNSALANISSTQAVNAAITATAIPSGVAKTTISGAVNASTVSANSNSLLALAIGSNANNTLAVIKPTNSVASTGSPIAVGSTIAGDSSTSNTLAFFDLQNVQSGQGSVTATQRTIVSSPDMGISITGNVNGSTLTADANTSSASATSNTATNNLSMNVGSLTSSSALQNVQVSGAKVNALIGMKGAAAVAAIAPKPEAATGQSDTYLSSDAYVSNSKLIVTSNKSVAFSTAGITDTNIQNDLENYFTFLGFSVVGHTATAYAGQYDISNFNNFISSTSGSSTSFKYDGFTKPGVNGTAGMPNQGGVTLAVSSSVNKSELSVSGNATSGFAAGNSASNSTSLQGNNIASGNGLTFARTATGINSSTANSVNADYMLQNKQNFTSQSVGNVINSDVFGTMAIAASSLPSITNSSLTVANNTQSATSVGNTATNSLALQANSVTAASALQSSQITGAVISASSNLEMFTPGSVANSSVLVSGNANRSLAVMNDVTNTVSVAGTQVGNGTLGTTVVTGFNAGTSAENVLSNYQGSTQPSLVNNVQMTTNTVSSTATTNLYNQESVTAKQAVLTNSSLSLSGNSTTAEASTNRAINTASVNSASTQAASVAIANAQQNVVAVSAKAVTTANVVLTSAPLNSSVLIGNNSTTSLARGNTASNTLESLAGSIYGVALNGMSSFDTNKVLTVSANAGISNAQSNSNAVSASSTATYRVALNSGDTSGVVNVSGNQVVAQAYGNNVTNTMTLNALNSNLPTSAIASYQTNSGAITATASSASFGISSVSGAVTNSNLRTTGNQVTATAVGNSVVSAMLAR